MLLLWPGLGTFDVNGSPKIIQKVDLDRLDLQSKDWQQSVAPPAG